MENEIKTSEDIQGILKALCCREIINILSSPHIDKKQLLTTVIASRTGYDNIISNKHALVFIKDIADTVCYQDENYQRLVISIGQLGSVQQDFDCVQRLYEFCQFHNTLYKVASVAIRLLSSHQASLVEDNGQAKVISIKSKQDEKYGYLDKVSSL